MSGVIRRFVYRRRVYQAFLQHVLPVGYRKFVTLGSCINAADSLASLGDVSNDHGEHGLCDHRDTATASTDQAQADV